MHPKYTWSSNLFISLLKHPGSPVFFFPFFPQEILFLYKAYWGSYENRNTAHQLLCFCLLFSCTKKGVKKKKPGPTAWLRDYDSTIAIEQKISNRLSSCADVNFSCWEKGRLPQAHSYFTSNFGKRFFCVCGNIQWADDEAASIAPDAVCRAIC